MRRAHRQPDEVLDDYRLLVYAIERLGVEIPGPDSPLLGMTADEMSARLNELRRELDLQTSLMLAGAFESELFLAWQGLRKALRKRIGQLLGRSRRKPSLDDLLDAWTTAAGLRSRAIGDFRQLLDLRHWLAHGRRWDLDPSGVRFARPQRVHERGIALLRALGIAA